MELFTDENKHYPSNDLYHDCVNNEFENQNEQANDDNSMNSEKELPPPSSEIISPEESLLNFSDVVLTNDFENQNAQANNDNSMIIKKELPPTLSRVISPEESSFDYSDIVTSEGDKVVTLISESKFISESQSKDDSEMMFCFGSEKDRVMNNPVLSENDIEIIYASTNGNTTNSHVLSENIEVFHDSNNIYEIDYDFSCVPFQITGSWKEFYSSKQNNFTRGCKWAPDGTCILTCSEDNILRIFNLPQQLWDSSQWDEISEMEAAVKILEGDLIYDYCWYPLMNSNNAATCCLASTSRKSTVHLWDGFTGELRCSYRAYNHLDEIVTPHSLSFDSGGERLFCGFEKYVRIFYVDSPGRNFEERPLFVKKEGQSGIISCFAFTSADKNISAAGSYQSTIGLYDELSGTLECILEGQKNGITQLQFSPDGKYLYSGGRKDPEILCWDMRNLGTVLFSLRRSNVTNQRMYFDITRCGKYAASGNQNGVITIWDVTKEPKVISENDFSVIEPVQFFLAHEDCVNGISLHPTHPLLCSSSGQRKFPRLLDEDDEAMFSSEIDKRDNSLRLWWIGKNN